MRFLAWLFLLWSPAIVLANDASSLTATPPAVQGLVADATGAIVPGAQVDLVEMNGTIAGTCHSGDDGNFEMSAPHAGNFTLVISEPGFETVQMPVTIAPTVTSASAGTVHVIAAPPLRITLPIASVATSVRVNADSSEDLTAPDDNQDPAVLSATDLKALPIFDNDYAGQ